MRKDLADIVCCPVHKSRLVLTVGSTDKLGDIVTGSFRCATCDFDYPIEDGIPNLLPPEYHVDEVKEAAKAATKPTATSSSKANAKPTAPSISAQAKSAPAASSKTSGKPASKAKGKK